MDGLTEPLFLGMLRLFHPAPVRSNGKKWVHSEKVGAIRPDRTEKSMCFCFMIGTSSAISQEIKRDTGGVGTHI